MTKTTNVCGMNEAGVDAFLKEAEEHDKGTVRYPWKASLRTEIKKAIAGMQFLPAVKERVNEIVVKKAGPGLHGRGPFNLDPRVR